MYRIVEGGSGRDDDGIIEKRKHVEDWERGRGEENGGDKE